MKKFLKLSFTAVIVILAVGSISSCKKSFDQPPSYVDPNLVANTTIKSLKALHTVSGAFDAVTSNIIISGIVTANDKSGNLYKEIYIQDETGAIAIELDATDVYTTYAVGRRLFVKCNGLTLSDYHGEPQLGMVDNSIPGSPALNGIPSTLIYNYLVAGASGNTVPYTVVTNYASLTSTTGNGVLQDSMLGRLIRLDNYEFIKSNLSLQYADTSSYKNSINLTINDCSGNSVYVRTSGYANFAALYPPAGHGSIYGIFTIYKASSTTTTPDKQLIIRDTSDVQFTGQRCAAFEEDFGSVTTNSATLALPGWKNIGEVGNVLYQAAIFGTTKCAKISAFGTGVTPVTSWLISPAISLAGITTPKLTFTSAAGYLFGATTFKVMVSTNYNGSNTPSTSTWTQLPATIATAPVSGYSSFISSGVLDLSAYAGQTIYIGFRYDGGDPTKTTTYEIDDIKVLRQ